MRPVRLLLLALAPLLLASLPASLASGTASLTVAGTATGPADADIAGCAAFVRGTGFAPGTELRLQVNELEPSLHGAVEVAGNDTTVSTDANGAFVAGPFGPAAVQGTPHDMVARASLPTDGAAAIAEVSFTLFCGQAFLPCPTGVTAATLPDGSVRLAWDAVAGATSYDVFRSTGGSAAHLATVAGTSFVDAHPDGGAYRIIALSDQEPFAQHCGMAAATAVPELPGLAAPLAAVAGTAAFAALRRRG